MEALNERYVENNRKNKNPIIKFVGAHISMKVYCVLISIMELLICTKSSPLYPFNDWVDSNAFFTMGKGMMNGKVLYRDLFEQKGPLLYFIHGLSYLISHTTFGVFIFEVISFSVFLVYCNKIIMLYLHKKYSYISLPLIAMVVLNLTSFSHGDSAEEFCIPLLTISLYYLIDYFKNRYPKDISYKYLFLNGMIAGCVLWTKYSMLGFWFGWMLMIFISRIINKSYLNGIKGSIIFLCGMCTSTIPWIIYFGINNAIFPWIDTYIVVNIKCYSQTMTLQQRIEFVIKSVKIGMKSNEVFHILCYIGIVYAAITKRFFKNIMGRISLIACFLLLALGVYGGGVGFVYYFLIFSPAVVLGFVAVFDFTNVVFKKLISNKVAAKTIIIMLFVILPINLYINHNTYMMKYNKSDLAQYKFDSIINQTKGATLLNYGWLDSGFYTVSNITPNVRFLNSKTYHTKKFPVNVDEQNRYIRQAKTEYVVLSQNASDNIKNLNIPYLFENYKLVADQKQIFEGMNLRYLLFKRK